MAKTGVYHRGSRAAHKAMHLKIRGLIKGMKSKIKRRFLVAIVFALLAHITAFVTLLPLYALLRALKSLFEENQENLRVALLLAILLHLAILLPLIQWVLTLEPDPTKGDMLTVDLWNSEQTDFENKEKTPEEELEDYEPEEDIPQGQVVEAPRSQDSRRPENSRFLAEHDNRVEKETKSRMRLPGSAQASTPSSSGKGQDSLDQPGGMRAEQHGMAPLPSDLEMAEKGQDSAVKRAPRSLEDINLEPSLSAMASSLAGSGLDHLENVIDGDATRLNTMGWRYASFFNRVKRRVEKFWHPAIEYRKNDPYGNIYGFRDRITVLLVVLRGDGSLKKVYVMERSGALFLDDEAKEAVEKAAPFPNVPDGLKDKEDGLVKFTFHFLVEVGEQPVFRIRRYE